MNNNVLLSLALKIIPILGICFVLLLLLHKFYFQIRSKYNAKVNCWFCNANTKVPYLNRNNWTCPECEQYNGFTKDGDYNREIFEQLDCSNKIGQYINADLNDGTTHIEQPTPSNGFCDSCNEAQRIKIEKIAQFEPKNESRFDEELKVYKAQLEEQYRLCRTCDRHLHRVLREKKKMILGTKFLDFIIKGVESIQQPHLDKMRQAKRETQKRTIKKLTTLIAIINVGCLISVLPTLRRETMTQIFGESLGLQLFKVISHLLAFGSVMASYLLVLAEHELVVKLMLFARTIAMMVMYSLGLRWPQVLYLRFGVMFVKSAPFILIGLAFLYKALDSFKITRFTFVMIVWCAIAGGICNMQQLVTPDLLVLFITIITLLLLSTLKTQPSPKLHDDSASSFHKMYSEDYLSDEDSCSMLSQDFNYSNASVRSLNSSSRFSQMQTKRGAQLQKSPLTSSTYSLNGGVPPPTKQFSPNSSFIQRQPASHLMNQSFVQQPAPSLYDQSMYSFASPTPALSAMSPRSTIFASNFELNRSNRAPSNTSTAFNQSFASCATYAAPQQHHATHPFSNNGSFSTSFNTANIYPQNGFASLQQQPPQRSFSVAPMPSMHSPFSASTNAVYQERATNLLTPSRFSTTCLANNNGGSSSSAAVNSWLVGNCFEERSAFVGANSFGTKLMDDNLSRASSRSSGFESQNGGGGTDNVQQNGDVTELAQPTIPLDSSSLGFKPITTAASSLYGNNSTCFRRTAALSGGGGGGFGYTRDTFNLGKIKEELPAIRRGDLLRKWKETQTVA